MTVPESPFMPVQEYALGPVKQSVGRGAPARSLNLSGGSEKRTRDLALDSSQLDALDLSISNRVYLTFKRFLDILLSLCALVVFSPIFVFVAIAMKIEEPRGRIIFRQPRFGKDCQVFNMYKFRSMHVNAEELLLTLTPSQKNEFFVKFKITNDPRITRIGRILRKTSIDELPQLLNILVGDMTIIGPRPPLLAEESAYGVHLAPILCIRPGLTGYWQAFGRSDVSTISERIEMNEYYIRNMGFALDIKIFWKTIFVVLKGTGAR